MPMENLEEDGLEKNPKLILAQWKFLIASPDFVQKKDVAARLMENIREENMAPYYEDCCRSLNWVVDTDLLEKMKAANSQKLKELDDAIEDAEKNLGEMEVREANLKKSEYLCRIGDKEAALSSFRKTYEKTVSLGHRLDIIFHVIRIGFFYLDHDLITRNIEKAQSLMEEGGDWDRRNRLQAYRGTRCLLERDFRGAAALLLAATPTFASHELMDFAGFVRYAAYVGALALPRNELRDKIIQGSEVLEVLHNNPDVKAYLLSLYNGHYADFFKNLAVVEKLLKFDFFLYPHYRYYVREMRIVAYAQLLESYRSLSLPSMAKSFGVTVDFIDREVSRFIAAGRLHCKIDRVGGVVETSRPDAKNWQYQALIKQGDLLLNRVQKLSRVINI